MMRSGSSARAPASGVMSQMTAIARKAALCRSRAMAARARGTPAVTPAKAGVHAATWAMADGWTPAFAGVTRGAGARGRSILSPCGARRRAVSPGRRSCPPASIDAEREILGVDLLIGPVEPDPGDRGVEPLAQRLV